MFPRIFTSHTSNQPSTESLPASSAAKFSLRKILFYSGIASFAGLGLSAGVLGAASTGLGLLAVTARPLITRTINSNTGNRTIGMDDYIHSQESINDLEQQLLAANATAEKENWSNPFEIPDSFPSNHYTMINAGTSCLEQDTDQQTLRKEQCTGQIRQRFQLKDNVLYSHDGLCLEPPNQSNTFSDIEKPSNCTIKLQPCSKKPVKFSTIDTMFQSKGHALAIRPDSQNTCYFEFTVDDDIHKEQFEYHFKGKRGLNMELFSDYSLSIQRCKYDHRMFEYPITCAPDNNAFIHPYYRTEKEDNLKYCQEFIQPLTPTRTPIIPGFEIKIPEGILPTEKSIQFNGHFTPRYNPHGSIPYTTKIIFTGLYSSPGNLFNITLQVNGKQAECKPILSTIRLQVGMHTDHLAHKIQCNGRDRDTSTEKSLLRPLSMHIERKLYTGINTIRAPYGGTIALKIPHTHAKCSFIATFTGVFEAPHLTAGSSSSKIAVNASTSSPWSVLEGKRLTSIIPTNLTASMEDIEGTISLLDEIADQTLELWGYDTDSPYPEKRHNPGNQNDILVEDIQITIGKAHAGSTAYPAIMIDKKASPFQLISWIAKDNSTIQRLTAAGLYQLSLIPHEMAHHLNPNNLLTTIHMQAMSELTAEYVVMQLTGTSLIAEHCGYGNALKHLETGVAYQNFPMPYADDYRTAGVFFRQLIDAFPEKGWTLFTNMVRHYRSLTEEQASRLITNYENATVPEDYRQIANTYEQARIDYFFELLCNLTHHNLIEHFAFWKIPVTESTKAKVLHMSEPNPPIDFDLQNNRRLFPKIAKDHATCPGFNTHFSEDQQSLLYTSAFCAALYGFYLISQASTSMEGSTTKIKNL